MNTITIHVLGISRLPKSAQNMAKECSNGARIFEKVNEN